MLIQKSLVAVAASIGLSACAPQGYTEAPVVSEYVSRLLPPAKRVHVEKIALCLATERVWYGDWYVTIGFEDGNAYHYKLDGDWKAPLPAGPVQFDYFTTEAQRKDPYQSGAGFGGCFGRGSEYLLHARSTSMKVYVEDVIIVNRPFSAEVKKRLQLVAVAVPDAVARQQKLVRVETTWGVKPQ